MQESVSIQPLLDQLFLLYTINKFETGIKITKLQKIIFLSQSNGNEKGYQTCGFSFIRYKYGPFSKSIDECINSLAESGLVKAAKIPQKEMDSQARITYPMMSAGNVVKLIKKLIKKNRSQFAIFDRVIDHLRPLPINTIKTRVYQTLFQDVPIKDVPMHTALIGRLPAHEIRHPFNISPEWIMTLEVLFNAESQQSIKEGLDDLRRGDVVKRGEFSESL
ncbi:MAG: hypothetical protein HWN65_14495 [Candidatus Helarchaeota archaeon]|nr:hypothetical protein [Candidatus Helarchaeota archaeon]